MLEKPQLVCKGYDFGLRNGIEPLAISKCEITLRSSELADECEKALLQFERILRKRPEEGIKYEWANICRSGVSFSFDIYWYDLRFFEQRKVAYRVGPHALAFQRFGATPDDFNVTHIRTTT